MTSLILFALVCTCLVASNQVALGIPAYADEDGSLINFSIEHNGDIEGIDIDISIDGDENNCGCEECDCQDKGQFKKQRPIVTCTKNVEHF